jgi:fucose permease
MGATVSPLIIGSLIERGLAWRLALAGTGLIWLAYGLVAYLFHRSEAQDEPGRKAQKLDLGMLREKPFLALFLIGFIYNGVAVSLLGWIAVIMQQMAGFSTFFSVSMISVFYVALTLGRFPTLLVLALGITLTYPLVVFGIHSPLVVAGVFLMGLSLSGLFPTALAYGARLYPNQAGTVSGTLSMALTLGSMVPPLWTGVVAEAWSFQAALGINYTLVLPLIFLAVYLARKEALLTAQQMPAPLPQSLP